MNDFATTGPSSSVADFVGRTGLPRPGETVLVGCSGGADSTALVLALADRGVPLIVVYVDHGLRARVETEVEARQVARLAADVGAAFEVRHVVVPRSGNLLARAREARYQALGDAARKMDVRLVAVGHTRTDQLETVAFRLERGAVEHALAGMPEVRSLDGDLLLIRPLLGVRRDETAAWVMERGIQAVRDPSNERTEFARARIRQALAASPMEEIRLTAMARTAELALARDDHEAAAMAAEGALEASRIATATDGVLLRLLRRAGLHRAGSRHVVALRALALDTRGSRGIDLGAGLSAVRTYERLVIGLAVARLGVAPCVTDVSQTETVRVAGPGRYRLGQRLIELALVEASTASRDVLVPFAFDRPLVLRTVRAGDRLRSRVGRRKLQDVFTDRKVPRALRPSIPLLAFVDEQQPAGPSEILWVDGFGIAPGLRAAPGSAGIRVTCAGLSDEEMVARDLPRG